jgi:hypothetical protein
MDIAPDNSRQTEKAAAMRYVSALGRLKDILTALPGGVWGTGT